MRRFLFAISGGLLVGLLAILFASSSASALSEYDEAVVITDDLYLYNSNYSDERTDVKTTYMDYVQDLCPTTFNQWSNNGTAWSVSLSTSNLTNPSGTYTVVMFSVSTSANPELKWSTNYGGSVNVGGNTNNPVFHCRFYMANNGVIEGDTFQHTDSITRADGNPKIFFAYWPVTYPEGYAGNQIPDSWAPPEEPDRLRPDYSWSVSTTGELRVTYLKNLSPFLTGYSTLVLDKMTTNWESVDERIGEPVIANPAGWMDETTEVPGAGYYMFNVSHNQQLDSPPWPENSNTHIDQVWVQFYWDGKTAVSGTTVGSKAGEIVNDLRDSEDPLNKTLNSLQINTFGLTNVILMPINFISTLPSFVNNCSPISLPIMGQNVSLECMRDRYQAWSPTVWAIWQTVVTAVVAFGLSFNLFRIVKNINTPHNDGIEMAKL